jgi:succinylglutamate desuccinylase
MTKFAAETLLALLLSLALQASAPSFAMAGEKQAFRLGEAQPYETPYYVFTGSQPGPVVLLQAGIHGDEIAGVLALDAFERALTVHNGTVVLIPRMNSPAVRRGARQINIDLNRAFGPSRPRGVYEAALADALTQLVGDRRVQYMATLHESRSLYDPVTKTGLGQTICYGVTPPPGVLAPWLALINRGLPDSKKFTSIHYPIPTSSTEVLVSRFSLSGGFCVETWSGFDLKERIRMQLLVAESFLHAAGIRHTIEAPCPTPTRQIRSALRAAGLLGEETRYLACDQPIRPFLRSPW